MASSSIQFCICERSRYYADCVKMESLGMKKNIVVFGGTGSGKSSIVNMILGKQVAVVSDSAVGCTFEFQRYSTDDYNIYDTVGLSEGTQGTISANNAVAKLLDFLMSLRGGVNLLIYVMKKDRINKSCEDNYKIFVNAICNSKVPVLLVLTHCESERRVGAWWVANKQHFDNYGMKFNEAISGCASQGIGEEVHPDFAVRMNEIYEETRSCITDAVNKNALGTGFTMKFRKWVTKVLLNLVNFVNIIRSWFNYEAKPYWSTLYEYLKRYGTSESEAREMANQAAAIFT